MKKIWLTCAFLCLFALSAFSQSVFGNEMSPTVLIPGAEVWIGRNIIAKEYRNQYPRHKVRLRSYRIEKYEVSNRQFCHFLNQAGNLVEPEGPWICLDNDYAKIVPGEGNCFTVKAGWEDFPVVGVSWKGAEAYARWYGRRLPTEAEWEYAACKGIEADLNRSKGWYSTPDEALSQEQKVGGKKTSPFGLYDMQGNVLEWCSDWYAANYYATSPKEDPSGPPNGLEKVVRGGSWELGARYATPTFRMSYRPSYCHYDLGFRCVEEVE